MILNLSELMICWISPVGRQPVWVIFLPPFPTLLSIDIRHLYICLEMEINIYLSGSENSSSTISKIDTSIICDSGNNNNICTAINYLETNIVVLCFWSIRSPICVFNNSTKYIVFTRFIRLSWYHLLTFCNYLFQVHWWDRSLTIYRQNWITLCQDLRWENIIYSQLYV